MRNNVFQNSHPFIEGNTLIRTPQREAYEALQGAPGDREIGIVLPVGCGKSGCITLAPFAFKARRALFVAPGVRIASQLYTDFDPTQLGMFYLKTRSLQGPPFPEPVEIRGTTTNQSDLDESDVVITNIQQLQGGDNRWLASLPALVQKPSEFEAGIEQMVAMDWHPYCYEP